MLRLLIALAFGALGAYIFVRALQALSEDTPYFPDHSDPLYKNDKED